MAEQKGAGGVAYRKVDATYFEKRGFRRYAGVWSLWALGVGAVISGHYSGWNLGLATGGWGGMLVAGILIMIMYLGLVFCIAEMAPALPHTGAAYSFARSAMGPWGGFITGLCENVEYVLTPAVIVFFIGSYMGAIFETPANFQPIWWVLMYAVFLALNIVGVELSFRVTLVVTLAALAVLVIFWISAFPHLDFNRWALNIAPDGTELVNPAQPSLEGTNVRELRDAEGKPLAREYIAAALEQGSAWVDYSWYRPGENTPARKRSYVRRVQSGDGTYVVGSGFYVEE